MLGAGENGEGRGVPEEGTMNGIRVRMRLRSRLGGMQGRNVGQR
jgi:hypothetical protein